MKKYIRGLSWRYNDDVLTTGRWTVQAIGDARWCPGGAGLRHGFIIFPL